MGLEQKIYDFSESYDLLTSKPSAFDKEFVAENRYPVITSTLDSYLDSNDDGDLTPAFEAADPRRRAGPFAVMPEYAQPDYALSHPLVKCIASDGSLPINAIYSSRRSIDLMFLRMTMVLGTGYHCRCPVGWKTIESERECNSHL